MKALQHAVIKALQLIQDASKIDFFWLLLFNGVMITMILSVWIAQQGVSTYRVGFIVALVNLIGLSIVIGRRVAFARRARRKL